MELRLIEARQQGPDHPVLWNVPETDYLKFYLFQVVLTIVRKPPEQRVQRRREDAEERKNACLLLQKMRIHI